MIIAVVGGRKFDNYAIMKTILDKLEPTKIVSGGANGADTLAYEYARKRGITFVCHPPLEDEKKSMGFARAAYRRNLKIVEHAELLVAFPDKESKGTWHSIRLAEKLNKPILIWHNEKNYMSEIKKK